MAAYLQHDVHIWEDKHVRNAKWHCRSPTGTATGQVPLATSQANTEATGFFSALRVR